jgi:hypothetical protein
MRRFTIPLIALAVMVSCMLTVFMLPKGADPVKTAQGYYDLERQRQDDQATATSRKTATDLWNLLPPFLMVAIIGGLGYTIIADHAERRRR